MTKCSKCGEEIPDAGKFCGSCGSPVAFQESPRNFNRGWLIAVVVVALGLAGFGLTGRKDGELEVKVRTDFIAGTDTSFVDGLNSGLSNPRMKKNFTDNLIEVTFTFDTKKISSDPARSYGLLYRFYDANGKPVAHEQVDYEMSQNIISAASGGTRKGSVTHALDMVSIDPATLRIIDKANIGFLSPDQIRW